MQAVTERSSVLTNTFWGDKSCALMGNPLLRLHRAVHRRELGTAAGCVIN